MGKTLIRTETVKQHICREDNAVYLNKSILLTCGAKDYIRNQGISIVYGEKPEPGNRDDESESRHPCNDPEKAAPAGKQPKTMEEILEIIIPILKQDHGVVTPESIERLSLKIISEVKALEKG